MRPRDILPFQALTALVICGMMAVCAGCATGQVNWSVRVGHYTYDQAVAELGPPEKTTQLSDGGINAQWIKAGGGGGSAFSFTSNQYAGPAEASATASARLDPNHRVLSLTFNGSKVLCGWEKNY
jgi:hypothetical protein